MKSHDQKPLADSLFLLDVEDSITGEEFQTLSISRTPTMLLSFAANKLTAGATDYFKKRLNLGAVDWRMLLLLARKPGVTSAEAAKIISVDKGTVSRSVSRLTDTALIVAGDLEANGRSRGLYLSASGRVMHDKVLASALSQQQKMFEGFAEDEIRIFCDLLLRFTSNLEELIESDNQAR